MARQRGRFKESAPQAASDDDADADFEPDEDQEDDTEGDGDEALPDANPWDVTAMLAYAGTSTHSRCPCTQRGC